MGKICFLYVPVDPKLMQNVLGDTCCFPFSLGGFKKFLEAELGVYIKSVEIGNSIVTDYKSGYLIHPNKQVGIYMYKGAFFCFYYSEAAPYLSIWMCVIGW